MQSIRSGKWKVLLRLPQASLTVDLAGPGIVLMDAMSPRQNLIELPLAEKSRPSNP
jgi:hypothetical protein